MVLPSVLSFFVTWSFARKLPPSEVDISLVTWWVCLFAVGVIVLMATERVTRGLLPLAALFKLSLVFPDEAPSRYGIALRTNSTKKLEKRIEEIRESGFPTEESEYAETMLELVAGLSLHAPDARPLRTGPCLHRHDRRRDRLPEESASKLRWAALLHDVGKIFVPAEILNKPASPPKLNGKSSNPTPGRATNSSEPLKEFLGEWVRHHPQFTMTAGMANGYPDRLAGTDIPLGARIVAVADAYDVMTSGPKL